MKFFSTRPRDLLLICGFVVLSHAILLPIMDRTRMIEKVMAMNVSAGELLAIMAFFLSRVATYLLVPPILAALLTFWVARRVVGSTGSSD